MKVLFSRKKKKYEEDDAYLPMEENEQGEELDEADEELAPEDTPKRKAPRRQLLMAALVLALGSAVYLNWQFDGNRDLTSANALSDDKEYGEVEFVSGEVDTSSSEETSSEETSSETSETESTSAETDENSAVAATFAQARLDREEARAKATELLQQVLDSTDSDEEARKEAVDEAAEIASNVLLESNIETLITAKGYQDCMVFIENDTCSVLVQTDLEQPNDAVVIRDIVMDQSGLTSDQIKIVVNQAE